MATMRRAPLLVVPLALLVAVAVVFFRPARATEGTPRTDDRRTPSTDPVRPELPAVGDREPVKPPPVDPAKAGAIRVVVTDSNGPLADARVAVLLEATHESSERTTDATGEVVFDGLRPGDWLVGARHRRFTLTTQNATVAEGRTTDVALRMTEGGRAEGAVVNGAGQPVAGAQVAVLNEARVPMHASLSAKTDDQGLYVIEGIPLAKVGLLVRASRYHPLEKYDIAFTTPGERQTHNFTLDAGTTVAGRVVDESGAPLADAIVTAGAIQDVGGTARTDRDGRFAIYGLGKKPLGLSASAKGYGTAYLRNVAPDTQDVELRLHRGGRLEGRVTPAIESFSVLLYRWEEDLGRNLLIRTVRGGSKTGDFVVTDVAPGEYLVAVDAPGYETAGRDAIRVLAPDGKGEMRETSVTGVKVVVRSGESVSGVALEVKPR
jgi:uncharacterized GH25 family protein